MKKIQRAAEVTLIASCGHASITTLPIDPQQNATDIAAVMSNLCIPCYKTSRQLARGICWADVNRSR